MGGRLEGKVAIVTGAARGQGRGEVDRFVAEGAQVVAGDVLDEVHELEGGAVAALHLDVTDEAGWAAAVSTAVERFGGLDVLINNAGVHASVPVHEMAQDDFRRVLDINLIGPFLGIGAVVPAMEARGGGSIVNVSSLNGLGAQARTAAYTASKFGLRGLTRAAAIDLGPLGIRVNAILPGVIRTPMVAYVVDEREEQLAAGLPMRRIGEPQDIASAAVFLASDDSQWITGTDITVDGGLSAYVPRLI